jgi:hypothetical protein
MTYTQDEIINSYKVLQMKYNQMKELARIAAESMHIGLNIHVPSRHTKPFTECDEQSCSEFKKQYNRIEEMK